MLGYRSLEKIASRILHTTRREHCPARYGKIKNTMDRRQSAHLPELGHWGSTKGQNFKLSLWRAYGERSMPIYFMFGKIVGKSMGISPSLWSMGSAALELQFTSQLRSIIGMPVILSHSQVSTYHTDYSVSSGMCILISICELILYVLL